MPQLNPNPWLAILFFTWLVFLVILPPKVMAFIYPNSPSFKGMKTSLLTSWSWPWH